MRMLQSIAFRGVVASVLMLVFGVGYGALPTPSSAAKPASCVTLHQDATGTMRSNTLTLEGKIRPFYYLGPPGYGEKPRTDRKDPGMILVLDHPLDICLPKNPGPLFKPWMRSWYEHVKRLGGMSGFYVGRTVKVTGTIYERDLGGEESPSHFLMDTKKICLAGGPGRARGRSCHEPSQPTAQDLEHPPLMPGERAINTKAVGQIVATINIGHAAPNGAASPTGVVLAPNDATAYVADSAYGLVSTINLKTNTVAKIVSPLLSGVSPAPVTATQAAQASAKIESSLRARGAGTLNSAQRSTLHDMLRSIENGPCVSQSATLSRDGGALYVTCGGLGVIDLHTDKFTHWVRTGDAQDAIAGKNDRVYVANFGPYVKHEGFSDGTVSVIDPHTWRVIKTIPVGKGAVSLTLGPKGDRLYVADMMDNAVSVIDTRTLKVMKCLHVPDGPFFLVVSPTGRTLYVSEAYGNGVAFVNARSGKLVARVRTGKSTAGLALSADGSRLYVANYEVGSVSLVDAKTHRLVGTLLTDSQPAFPVWGPFMLAIDHADHDLYVTEPGSGKVFVIKPAKVERTN